MTVGLKIFQTAKAVQNFQIRVCRLQREQNPESRKVWGLEIETN